jgi:uncharacterized protein YkwD
VSAIAVLLACLPGAARASDVTSACPNAMLMPSAAAVQQSDDAVLCLVNAERAERGIAPLRTSHQLTRAALAHSTDMVKRRYFSHVTPAGLAPLQRVKRTGYLRKRTRGVVNETLAIGTAQLSTPAALVRSLMDDLPHRRIVLGRRYRDVGVGLVVGYPIGDDTPDGATLTIDYGHR